MNHKLKFYVAIAVSLLCTACVRQTAMPLGNDLMEIDVSTSAVYRRAGAQEFALQKAAQATLDAGYDKFIVVQSNAWNEQTTGSASFGNLNGSVNGNVGTISGQQSAVTDTQRSPEVKMIIHMYHDGDKGSAKAVDARSILKQ